MKRNNHWICWIVQGHQRMLAKNQSNHELFEKKRKKWLDPKNVSKKREVWNLWATFGEFEFGPSRGVSMFLSAQSKLVRVSRYATSHLEHLCADLSPGVQVAPEIQMGWRPYLLWSFFDKSSEFRCGKVQLFAEFFGNLLALLFQEDAWCDTSLFVCFFFFFVIRFSFVFCLFLPFHNGRISGSSEKSQLFVLLEDCRQEMQKYLRWHEQNRFWKHKMS